MSERAVHYEIEVRDKLGVWYPLRSPVGYVYEFDSENDARKELVTDTSLTLARTRIVRVTREVLP